MNGKQNLIIFMGLALIGLNYWFSEQRGNVRGLFQSPAIASMTSGPSTGGAVTGVIASGQAAALGPGSALGGAVRQAP